MFSPVVIPVLEPSQAGEARRKAIAFASRLGFSQIDQGKVSIVVTEIANNLANHAHDGRLLIGPLENTDRVGIEILSLDKGPGISNISACLQDGFSTNGTPGNGLGAIKRLSDLFEIYSIPDEGTAILCQLWAKPVSSALNALDTRLDVGSNSLASNARLEIGVVCLPKQGEEVSGDTWASEYVGDRQLILVSDGLGHGPSAAEASLAMARIFHEQSHQPAARILEIAHPALRSTRGVAVAITEIDFQQQSVQYAGIGNIAGCLYTPDRSTSMVSYNGTVGHEVRKISAFNYTWQQGNLLIMHSDGLRSQWRLDRYPGLFSQHPTLIAGILYRDFNRERDDVTVLVAREVNQR